MANIFEDDQINKVLFAALQSARQKKIDISTLTLETKLREDLGLDSLTLMEAVWELEEKLHIHIDENKLLELSNIGEVIQLVNELVKSKESERNSESDSANKDGI